MPIVIASSFADLADVEAFKKAKAKGLTDQEAFKVGDNGVGAWGDFTAQEDTPMCALPPEDWLENGARLLRREERRSWLRTRTNQ